MKRKGIRIAAMFMVMLVMNMFVVMPAMACASEGTYGEEACSDKTIVGEIVELKGNDKNQLLDRALGDKTIINLKEELKKDGFKQKDIETYSLEVIPENGSVINAKIATFKFESAKGDIDELTYVYNEQTGESFAIRGAPGCPQCLALIVLFGFGCFAWCVSAGVLTMGVACVGCLAAAAVVSLCTCYTCGCSLGFEEACDMADQFDC
ncbi:MAG: hypothetical protein GQ469_03105 [Methanosarcinales archaeon]|nr:hypothetical protein [Methanosarcinales archaeon]